MPKPPGRNPSGYKIEISQIVPQIDLEAPTGRQQGSLTKDETERLTRMRRQHSGKDSAISAAVAPTPPPPAKAGFWARLFGRGTKPEGEA